MQCKHAEPLIGAWQDGELDAWTAWRVGRHVRQCPTCAAEAEGLTGLTATLRRAAPLGVSQPVPAPRRNRNLAPLALTLASATVAAFLITARSPAPPTLIAEPRPVVHHESTPHRIETLRPPTPPVTPIEKRDTPRITARKPAMRHVAARKNPGFPVRPIRVSRKPSLLPPLTHPEWSGSSIRYVATLTEEERQVEIISVESELPPLEELKRLVEEKSEFIFVQASLPPELREGSQIPIQVIP